MCRLWSPSDLFRCNNGHLSAYLRGQDITDEKPDHVFCGHILPNPLVTSNPRLLLVFNTTNARYSGRGFRAKFQFLTGKLHLLLRNSHAHSQTTDITRSTFIILLCFLSLARSKSVFKCIARIKMDRLLQYCPGHWKYGFINWFRLVQKRSLLLNLG